MQKNTNIQSRGLAHVRKHTLTKRSRIGLIGAGAGCACALLLGGIFTGHSGAENLQHQTNTSASVVRSVEATGLSAYSSQARTTSLSYSTVKETNNSYRNIARQAAANAGINPNLFERQIQQESGFNPWAVSPAGAQGIAQFMPGTASNMGVNPWNPTSALYGAARLMAQLNRQFGGNYGMALAAYNAGPGAVQRAIHAGGNNWYSFLPSETRHYVSVIMG